MTTHISNSVSNVTSNLNTSESLDSQAEQLDESRVNRIFAYMQAHYGSRWRDQTGMGDALKFAKQVWAKKLAGVNDKQIMHGLDRLPEDFPPSPGKFKRLCVENADKLHNTAAYKPFDRSKALELKPDKEKAKSALAEIRQTLARA